MSRSSAGRGGGLEAPGTPEIGALPDPGKKHKGGSCPPRCSPCFGVLDLAAGSGWQEKQMERGEDVGQGHPEPSGFAPG